MLNTVIIHFILIFYFTNYISVDRNCLLKINEKLSIGKAVSGSLS